MRHRELLERWFSEVWGKRNAGLISELLAPDCVLEGLGPDVRGVDGFRGFFDSFCRAFPKVSIAINECLEVGDDFACHCTATLTDFDGRQHVFPGAVFGTIKDGKFTRTRDQWDFVSLLESTKTVRAGAVGRLIEAQIPKSLRPTAGPPVGSHREFWERWFHELWGRRNRAIIDECVSEDCRIVGLPDTVDGRTSFHEFFSAFGAAFPVVHIKVEDCVEEGEKFAIRCSGHLVDRDGREHAFSGGAQGKIRDGVVIEAWNQWDFLNVLDSMGKIQKDALASTIKTEATRD